MESLNTLILEDLLTQNIDIIAEELDEVTPYCLYGRKDPDDYMNHL